MNEKLFVTGLLILTCAAFFFNCVLRAEVVTAQSGDNMWSWVAYNDEAGRPNSHGLRLINENDPTMSQAEVNARIWKAIYIIQDINKKLSEKTDGIDGNQITAIHDPNLIVAGKKYWLPGPQFINNVLNQFGSGDQNTMRGSSGYDAAIDNILNDPALLDDFAAQTGRDRDEVFNAVGVDANASDPAATASDQASALSPSGNALGLLGEDAEPYDPETPDAPEGFRFDGPREEQRLKESDTMGSYSIFDSIISAFSDFMAFMDL